jgi:antitoxin component of MazEF toxin-antitoxin module
MPPSEKLGSFWPNVSTVQHSDRNPPDGRSYGSYTLQGLLRGMTKENVPQEVEWDEPRGDEAW